MTAPRRANRGRNAAESNRQALVTAALEVFAEGGLDAPLSAVVKRAGVGQGSLYRHFPDRISLALAAFEHNVAQLEALAAKPGTTLDDLLAVITRQTLDSIAFVDMVTGAAGDPRLCAVSQRVRDALTGPLETAQQTGKVRPSLAVDELMLAIGMVAALVAKVAPEDRRQTADDAWALLMRAVRP